MIITGRTSILELIETEKARQKLSNAQLCKRAGVAKNTIYNLRHNTRRNMNVITLLALVNALGLVLAAVPE